MTNCLKILKMTFRFAKRPKYLGNDVDLWEMALICGEMT